MTTHDLAYISNHAMYAATIVYALAMLAHIAEWAQARDLPALVPETPARALVMADQSADTRVEAASANDGSTVVKQVGGGGADRDDDPVERSDRFGRIGLSLTVLGVMLQLVGVVCRGLAAQRPPWGSMYEFTITISLAVGIAYLALVRRYQIRWLGLLVTGFLTVVLGLAVILLYRPAAPLVPALHSYWLYIHVSAAAIAGGAFTVGALASVLYLIRSSAEDRAVATPSEPKRGFIWRTPSAEAIDRLAYRVHAFAFPLWTFAVMAGAIWAQYAWGRFWGWDPKEVWAFITWVAYAAYLHARATAGWRGRAAAYVALAGYATFIFNFVGINLFGSGMHTYSGM